MRKNRIEIENIPVEIYFSSFKGSSGIEEYHLTFTPQKYSDFETQIKWIKTAYKKTLDLLNIDEETSVFKRFFCSDIYNQIKYLKEDNFSNPESHENKTAISLINQIPLPDGKISLWSYHLKSGSYKIEKEKKGKNLFLKTGNLIHTFSTGIIYTESDSVYEQTKKIIENYINFLKENGMEISKNLIRTWFFIKNIDTDYGEFVKGRKEIYEKNNLKKDTHYVASTGVGGFYYDLKAKILLDAYAIYGIEENQIKFLSAPEYLSPPYIYGVTFERGVCISYSDRKHLIISGTASINNRGEIIYEGDVNLQTERTLKNIEALLKNENATLEDVMVFIVYLRDPVDYHFVKNKMREKFKDTPIIFVNAPVCRPGWLIEIECIAIIQN